MTTYVELSGDPTPEMSGRYLATLTLGVVLFLGWNAAFNRILRRVPFGPPALRNLVSAGSSAFLTVAFVYALDQL